MKLDLSQWKLKKDVDRLKALHWLHFLFFFLSFAYYNISHSNWITFLLVSPIILIFYRLYYQTLEKLYYTYWSFTAFLLLYCFLSFFFLDLSVTSIYLRMIAMMLILTQAWVLHDPIYYPIVSWWEYDFRYRDDIKVEVKHDEKTYEGRLTDLRRKSGCLSLFEEVEVGEELEVNPVDGHSLSSFKLKVMSKRETSVGRPFNYGVKFVFNSNTDKQEFQSLYHFWKNERKVKLQQKFLD